MAVTVPGDSGVLVRSPVVVELVPDPAPVPTLRQSMAATTAQSWDRVMKMEVATTITARV